MDCLSILDHYGLLRDAKVAGDGIIKIVCPLHDEKNASMSINIAHGTYYCFGCDSRGNIIDLIARVEHVNSLQALHKITQLAKDLAIEDLWKINNELPVVDKKRLRKDAHAFFYSLPQPSWEYIRTNYMLERGFTQEILCQWDVRINTTSKYPIIVPITEQGIFKGYVARRTDGGEPKYLYNKGLQKRTIVAGAIRSGTVLVVEGLLDAMMAQQHGFSNTCALLGWKCSAVQAEKIQRHAAVVVCATDNDAAGEKGYAALCKALNAPVVRFAFPPGRKDICEMPKTEFRAALRKTLAKQVIV